MQCQITLWTIMRKLFQLGVFAVFIENVVHWGGAKSKKGGAQRIEVHRVGPIDVKT